MNLKMTDPQPLEPKRLVPLTPRRLGPLKPKRLDPAVISIVPQQSTQGSSVTLLCEFNQGTDDFAQQVGWVTSSEMGYSYIGLTDSNGSVWIGLPPYADPGAPGSPTLPNAVSDLPRLQVTDWNLESITFVVPNGAASGSAFVTADMAQGPGVPGYLPASNVAPLELLGPPVPLPNPNGWTQSQFNYIFYDAGTALTGVSVTIDITSAALVGSTGWGFQLNTYAALSDSSSVSAVCQQFWIFFIWGDQGSFPGIEGAFNGFRATDPGNNASYQAYWDFYPGPGLPLPDNYEVPVGYQLKISLHNDADSRIDGVTYSIYDQNHNLLGSWPQQGSSLGPYQPLTDITLYTPQPMTAADLSTIVAFTLNAVGPIDGIATALSGGGTITYTADNDLTPLSSYPAGLASPSLTVESSNVLYGLLPAGPSQVFTQSFTS